MSDELLVRHCSPTLAGMKTGNIFNCRYADRDELKRELRELNKRLRKKGLRLVPLRYSEGIALLYLYRPCALGRDLSVQAARDILRSQGYVEETPTKCLHCLMRRICESEDFPHEIGLFLGYPPEDVSGFIENREDFKCVGVWKVYGNADAAKRTFEKYRKCTRVYCDRFACGASIDRLALAKA